jgi:N-acetylglucosamine-6-phosphate deacetylase
MMKIVGRHVITGEVFAVTRRGDPVWLPTEGSHKGLPLQVNVREWRVTPTDDAPEPNVFISPGWIDIQVNGFAGGDFNAADATPETVAHIVARLADEGVVQCLPTVITQSHAHMAHCLRTIANAMAQDANVGEAMAGIHIEGPWISPVDGARGAHPLEHARRPTWDEFERLQDAAQGHIKLVTLAPEIDGAISFVEQLVRAGVIVALGHTMASTQDIANAVQAGATLSTHLGNGAPAMLPRHPNMIWDQLADDRLYASAIFDGHHLPAGVMRVLAKVKGPERLILTSDAVALARMLPGIYDAAVGGKVELRADGRLSVLGTPYLAGSASSLKDGVEHAVRDAGVSLADACRMASITPAALLDLPQPRGFTVFRWDLAATRATILCTVR